MLWEGMDFGWTEVGYSGVAYPLVDEALRHAARLGYRRIIIFPYFLFTGVLVKRIYAWVDEAAAAYPEIEFLKAQYLRDHHAVIDTFAARLDEIESGQNLMNCQMCKYREQIIGYETEVGTPQQGHHHHVRGIGTEADHGHHHHHRHGHHHGHGKDGT
jgi:sirohydrochlorin cobaltochelatase